MMFILFSFASVLFVGISAALDGDKYRWSVLDETVEAAPVDSETK